MHLGNDYDDEEIKRRFRFCYGEDSKREVSDEKMVQCLREKWENLSEYLREIKQRFSRFYNKQHKRKGFFWSERFKSVIVDNGETLINCLAYIDLNPVRAGIVKRPETYRWCSLGYHVQSDNEDAFLSIDFGLKEFSVQRIGDRLGYYRQFVYEKGGLTKAGKERVRDIGPVEVEKFRHRSRYFTDSGIIGTNTFVSHIYQDFKDHFLSKHPKKPKVIQGLDGIFSLKRLSEDI